ncbi:MAG: hypothetical protein NVS3B12_34060 [Acidimicrobiales bacterium]
MEFKAAAEVVDGIVEASHGAGGEAKAVVPHLAEPSRTGVGPELRPWQQRLIASSGDRFRIRN